MPVSKRRKKRMLLWALAAIGLVVALLVQSMGHHKGSDTLTLAATVFSALVALVAADESVRPTAELDDSAELLAAHVSKAETSRRTQVLGNGLHPMDLAFVRQETLGTGASGAEPQGRFTGIADYYLSLRPRRLVVTGAAGAGKTTLALHLVAELVARRRPDDPVPVRVSLVGWDPDKTKFQPWLIDRIHRLLGATGLSFDQVENLVRAHRVLPVLDDLDQMDPPGTPAAGSLAVHALQKLRAYHDSSASAPLILLCRSDVYRRLQDARIELPEAAHVRLEPVSADQVIRYLAERSENPSRWEPVSNRMTARPDGVLAQALNTPWHVNLAATVYEERDQHLGTHLREPVELLDFSTHGAVTNHLLEAYLPATLRRQRPELTPRSIARTSRWLTNLASLPAPTALRADIALFDIWRTVGRRVRVAEMLLAVLFLLATFVLPMHAHHPLRMTAELLTVGAWVLYRAWRGRLPKHKDFQLLNLRSRQTRRMALRRFGKWTVLPAIGLVIGGLVVGLALAHWRNPPMSSYQGENDIATALGVGIGLAILYAFTLGPAIGATLPTPDDVPDDPRRAIRRDTLGGVVFVLIFLVAHIAVLLTVSYALHQPLHPGGLYPRFATAFALYGWSDVSRRYLVFLLVTRGRLPFRLGAFLNQCHQAAILRTSGAAYQFRQPEFRTWLATRHTPSTWRRAVSVVRRRNAGAVLT